jgi:hypothetical protein
MTTTVTIFRYYFKSIELEIDQEHIEGLTPTEIGEKFDKGEIPYDEEAVHNTSLQGYEPVDNDDTDRYDIHDEDGEHIYGGHL